VGIGVKQPGVEAVDGRAERWREYRQHRRAELVEAALEALAAHGPDVRMEQIAHAAGIAKPKLYRHFADRDDLVDAITARVAELIVARLAGSIRPGVTVREAILGALDAYFALVDEQPNAFQFLIANTSAHGARDNAIIANARAVAALVVTVASADLRAAQIPTAGTEPLAHAMIGAVLGATDWWLLQPVDARMPRRRLVEQLGTALLGAADASLQTVGLALDPDAPALANHFRAVRTESPGGTDG
jgi:AcrR family transcriptional regulator